MEEVLIRAYDLASKYFDGIKDKGGHEYIGHLRRVSDAIENESKLKSIDEDSDEYQFYVKARIVALLHDTLEDTKCTIDELKEIGCTDEIITAIKSLTHKEHEHYLIYIARVSCNPISKLVKIHDLEDNMDLRRLVDCRDRDLTRVKKYFYCRKYLLGLISFEELSQKLQK